MVREYLVDVARRCVRVRLSGVLTGAAFVSTLTDLHRDPRVTPEFCALLDLRDVRSVDGLHLDEARTIAFKTSETLTRRDFVAHHPAVFAFCRMFAICRDVADGEPVAVFHAIRDAEEWLDLPPSAPDRRDA